MPSTISIKKHHILDKDLEEMINHFFSYRDWNGLYLTGGTCLAEFYFGHRQSVDLDLFTQERKIFFEARQLLMRKDFFASGELKSVRSFPEFSEFLLVRSKQDPIKIDLVLDVPIRIQKPVLFEKIYLDSLLDITANKLGRLIQRNEIKDYLDLFYLIPTLDLSTKALIELGQKKEGGLDPLVLAHQMRFIQTVKSAPTYFLANVPWKQVQMFFGHLHDEILDKLLFEKK